MKKKILKTFVVPILNDEYKIYVYIGDMDLANKKISKYFGDTHDLIEPNNRGKSIYQRGLHPVIFVDGNLDYIQATATLAHEAIHAVTNIIDYINMNMSDWSTNEILAHSVSAVIRKCLRGYNFIK